MPDRSPGESCYSLVSLTVFDLATPSIKIAKMLKNVDAYAIDGETNTLYVAQLGKLLCHPI